MAAAAYQESDQDVLFILKVDMGSGKHEFINYVKDDTPEQAAFRFCQEHSLNIKVYDFISEALRQKLFQLTHNQIPPDTRSKGASYPDSARDQKDSLPRGTESTNDATRSKNLTTVTKEKITTTTVKSTTRVPIADETAKKEGQTSTERIINKTWKISQSPEPEDYDEEKERVLGKSAEKMPTTPNYRGN